MRNKFTELIEKGVARFDYTPIAPDVPEQDYICRFYNNIWSIPSDTHMHYNKETGERYITGHMVGIEDKWCNFVNSSNWGGVNFKSSGYWCLNNFLQENGLCGNFDILNGETIYVVTGIDFKFRNDALCCPNCYVTSESKIPQPISTLIVNGDVMKIKECYNGKYNLYEVANALNENIYIKGNNWTVGENNLMCPIGNKVYILS